MADDSPDTPTVWKDTKFERLPPRLDIEEQGEEDDASEHGASHERKDRPTVDWMDFEKADGGDTRKMVNLGLQEEESQHKAGSPASDASRGSSDAEREDRDERGRR